VTRKFDLTIVNDTALYRIFCLWNDSTSRLPREAGLDAKAMIGLWKPSSWVLTGFAPFLVFSSANADNKAVDSVVVTASRLEQPADMLSQTIAITTREEIERLWAASAASYSRRIR